MVDQGTAAVAAVAALDGDGEHSTWREMSCVRVRGSLLGPRLNLWSIYVAATKSLWLTSGLALVLGCDWLVLGCDRHRRPLTLAC